MPTILDPFSIHCSMSIDALGPRPLTASPTHTAYRTMPRQTLMSDNTQSLNMEQDISKVYDREHGIFTPLPSESSPGRSFEHDKTVRHVEGHGIPQGGELCFYRSQSFF